MVAGLTNNALAMIRNGELVSDGDLKPVVQVTDLKLITSFREDDTAERYRLLLSDGIHIVDGMLSLQLNRLIDEGKLKMGSIVEMSQFVCETIQNRKIIIVIDLNILVEECDLIGDPQPYTQTGRTAIERSLKNVEVSVGEFKQNEDLVDEECGGFCLCLSFMFMNKGGHVHVEVFCQECGKDYCFCL